MGTRGKEEGQGCRGGGLRRREYTGEGGGEGDMCQHSNRMTKKKRHICRDVYIVT